MFNMNEMVGKLREMQAEMEKVRQRLDEILVEADAGGGMVVVQANANKRVMKVTIDPEIANVDDLEMIEDLVAAAVNKALERAEAAARDEMAKATKGFIPPGGIPGFDLGLEGK